MRVLWMQEEAKVDLLPLLLWPLFLSSSHCYWDAWLSVQLQGASEEEVAGGVEEGDSGESSKDINCCTQSNHVKVFC